MRDGLPVVITDGQLRGVVAKVWRAQKTDDRDQIGQTIRIRFRVATGEQYSAIVPRSIVSPIPTRRKARGT